VAANDPKPTISSRRQMAPFGGWSQVVVATLYLGRTRWSGWRWTESGPGAGAERATMAKGELVCCRLYWSP
jgi:hypothetical protein